MHTANRKIVNFSPRNVLAYCIVRQGGACTRKETQNGIK